MTITKDDFKAYLAVQRSGITNMFDVRMVNQLSGLEKPQIFDIMTNYAKYEKEFGLSVGSAE
jgi:hypothetical protein